MGSIDERLKKLLEKELPKKPIMTPHRKRKWEAVVDLTKLDELCETELVTIAHMAGYKTASRQLLREDLIALILGELTEPSDVLGRARRLLYAFTQQNAVMMSQMPCDLDCPNCDHHTVVECYTTNRDLVEE